MQHPKKMLEEAKDLLLDAYEQALVMICDIGLDYDGEKSVEGLKGLVDELVKYAEFGLNGIRPQYIRNGLLEEMVLGKWVKVPEERVKE